MGRSAKIVNVNGPFKDLHSIVKERRLRLYGHRHDTMAYSRQSCKARCQWGGGEANETEEKMAWMTEGTVPYCPL